MKLSLLFRNEIDRSELRARDETFHDEFPAWDEVLVGRSLCDLVISSSQGFNESVVYWDQRIEALKEICDLEHILNALRLIEQYFQDLGHSLVA